MSTESAEAYRQAMVAALDAGQRGRFLAMSVPFLALNRDDQHIRLLVLREYLQMGLVGPAKELILECPSNGRDSAELSSVYASIRNLAGGALPWQARRERFEQNLQAARQDRMDTGCVRRAWQRHADRFELFVDRTGVDQVRYRDEANAWRWMAAPEDHQANAASQPLPDGLGTQMPMPVLLDGIDLGWLFDRIYRATLDTFVGYGCALMVVEPDPALIALALHLHEWQDVLSDSRVFWFVGPDWARQLKRAWEDHPDLPLPHNVLFGVHRPPCAPPALDIVNDLGERRAGRIETSLQELNARYANRDVSYWADRFKKACAHEGPPLRILAAVSTHTTFLQYAMRDVKHALESLGHECEVLSEKTPYEVVAPLTYHDRIRSFEPDVFFVFDHLRHEFTSLIPENLPLLCWDQDELPQVFTAANMRRIPKQDFVAGWAKYNFVQARCNPKQYFATHIPSCPDQYGCEPCAHEAFRSFECDVSYVSHASQTPEQFHAQERMTIQDECGRRLLDELFEMAPAMLARYRVMEIGLPAMMLEEASRRCGVKIADEAMRRRIIGWYLWRLGDRLFRHEALEWVAAWARQRGARFRIHGNGWENHPTLAEFAAGPVQNGRALADVCRASRINLQLMPAGFIHQRALDGLMSGGFFLTRETPQDRLGAELRTLANRIAALGVNSTQALLDCRDPVLVSALQQYFGRWLHRFDPQKPDLMQLILSLAEMPQAIEVFPDLPNISFDSREAFGLAADRFLESPQTRLAIANRMQDAVKAHFTYEATMRAMLAAMADYLQHVATPQTLARAVIHGRGDERLSVATKTHRQLPGVQ